VAPVSWRRLRAEHDLFGDLLDRGGEIHVELAELGLTLAGWPAEELVKLPPGHAEAAVILEIAQIEPEAAVRLDVDQMAADRIGINRLPIGSQAHQLVLPGVDFESAEIGKCGIKEPERMRKVEFLEQLDPVSPTNSDTGGGPLAHPVHRQNSSLLEG